jgi:hypothetical protein
MENAIRLLLGLDMLNGNLSTDTSPGSADRSPEMYLGSKRQAYLASAEGGGDGTRRFSAPPSLPPNRYALQGLWAISGEYVRLAAPDGELRLHFMAGEVHIVASAASPVTLDIQVDGKTEPPVTVRDSGLYTLYRGPVGPHQLTMRMAQPGICLYTLTFD